VSELELTLGWVADAVGGWLPSGDRQRRIGAVVIDSRAVEAGDLFVALRGPRFDGHTFVPNVMERGAVAAIVEHGFDFDGKGTDEEVRRAGLDVQTRQAFGLIEVGDTLKALQDLAGRVRRAAGTRVVAITGSAGKTTTKEAIAEFLATRLRVVKNKGNLNNHIGLPLSLMQLRTRPDVAVMELGMNHAGEISTLVDIAAPDVRVWTNVGDAHLGFFASADAIADAKAEILERAGAADVLVCNADDARVMARARSFPGRTVTFGLSDAATVRARDVQDRGVKGMRARVLTPAGEIDMETPLLGRGNLANVLAATAVALDFGIPLEDMVATAARLVPAERRGAVRQLRRGVMLIDDSYNSSPAALHRALEVLALEPEAASKVAVLGEMLELGDHSMRLHDECGRAAAAAGLRLLVAVGGDPARALANAAVVAGLPQSAVKYFETSHEAADAIAGLIQDHDLVLVKGSRGTRTDLVADRLAAECA
jgi:UDP-N-acetylmuramoyl-tripeptide--D-alanyl-D-alanine ligase